MLAVAFGLVAALAALLALLGNVAPQVAPGASGGPAVAVPSPLI